MYCRHASPWKASRSERSYFKKAVLSATIRYMKALVISDTHIRRAADLEPLYEDLKPFLAEVDMIIHAGDWVVREAVDYFKSLKPVRAVRGNMDPGELLHVLPERLVFEFGRYKIGLVHGWGQAAGLRERVYDVFAPDGVDAVIFGHSHRPHIGMIGAVLMLNPGSATDTRFADRNTVILLEAGDELRAEIVEIARR